MKTSIQTDLKNIIEQISNLRNTNSVMRSVARNSKHGSTPGGIAFGTQNMVPHPKKSHLEFKTSLRTGRSRIWNSKHRSTPGEVAFGIQNTIPHP
jgi:hypothetical protein